MVHMLSARNRSEFMAVPELVRFTLAQGQSGQEATLLIKSSTLSLKYIVLAKRLDVSIVRLSHSWLGYSVKVPDDPNAPGQLWSVVESSDELDALKMLSCAPSAVAFLFNELSVSVAWADVQIDFTTSEVKALIEATTIAPLSQQAGLLMQDALDSATAASASPTRTNCIAANVPTWHPTKSTYITNGVSQSPVSLFSPDEGGQQEEVALWLVDNLHPNGAVKSPQVHEPSKVRELTDLMLSYEHGYFLLESKTLSVIGRSSVPTRKKLTQGLNKHLRKATSQLIGGVANVRRGCRITDQNDDEVDVNRALLPHIIILVPDLSLLTDEEEFGGSFFKKVMAEAAAIFHILDPSELLRMVQVAEMVAGDNAQVSKIMAFDWYLMERAKIAVQMPTAHFGMLFEKPGRVRVIAHG